MISDMFVEFWDEHQRVMYELGIGELLPNTPQTVDYYGFLADFAAEIGATLVVRHDSTKTRVARVCSDLAYVATSFCDESVTLNELINRLLIVWVGLHSDNVKVKPVRGMPRQKNCVGRILNKEQLIAAAVDQLRFGGFIDPEAYEVLLDGELKIDPVSKKRRLKPGKGKKGSRRRRDQIRRSKERAAKKAELAERRARGEVVMGRPPLNRLADNEP